MVVQHFLWNKVNVRDKLFEHLKIPRVTLRTGGRDKWHDLANQAARKLSRTPGLQEVELRRDGLVSKLDYSEGSEDVYFHKYLRSNWKYEKASAPTRKRLQGTAPKNIDVSFEPFVQFIKNEEMRAFTSTSSKGTTHRLYDLYYVKTKLNVKGQVEWHSPRNTGLNDDSIGKKTKKEFTRVKNAAMEAMTKQKKHWSGCLQYLMFRIDMSMDKTGDMGVPGKVYLNEVEVFPNCSTFLVDTEDDLNYVIKLAKCSQLYISEAHQVGGYFCL